MDIQTILRRMTLEDKIALCSGASFWETKKFEKYGIPALFMTDGPHGLRKQVQEEGADMLGLNHSTPSTCFPAEVTTASSWDPELLEEIGGAIGEEARTQGVGLVLGPGVNMKRNPLCGRNFEYFSEDPLLAGKLAAGFIRGIEAEGVGSSLKHFAANSQEKCRFNSDGVMDERTLRELYLPAFETAVKEGKPSTVMCAYPKLNGVHCSDNKKLLTDILRDEWGFEGMVVTDWGAMNDRVEAFRAGCDLSMPGGSDYMEAEVAEAVRKGELSQNAVDACAERVLRLVFRAQETLKQAASTDTDAHHTLAKKAATQGAVLLKNEDGLLPLEPDKKIAVIGAMAKEMRYQGAGSSHINPTKLSQPIDYLKGVFALGCDERGDTTDALIAEAVAAAKGADAAVVFAGLPARYESEGFDRENMAMPEGCVRLIREVSKANGNTAVVLLCGAPVECPWADDVKAILYMGLPGQAGGEAIADLIYGKANPGGKLAESWPVKYEDCVSSPYYAKEKDALYLEGIYTGYRYYDKAGKAVRWPFGHGLSYTRFSYESILVAGDKVCITVKNVGPCSGAEVVQLYIEAPQSGIHRPIRELKGFKKVRLDVGEQKEVEFMLDERAFSVWHGGWVVPEGEYTVCVGGSSRDLPLRAKIYRSGVKLAVDPDQGWYGTCQGVPTQGDLETALGKKYRPALPEKGQYTLDNSIEEMREHSLAMRLIYKSVERNIAKGFGGKADYENPDFRMMMNASAGGPLRSMQILGFMKGKTVNGLLDMANGHRFKGFARLLFGK